MGEVEEAVGEERVRGSEVMVDERIDGVEGAKDDETGVGERMAPTAVERETLLGRTRKALAPGMIRRPYFSPRLSKMWFCASAAWRSAHCLPAV